MLRQLLVSFVLVVAAAAGYVLLVPGAPETLARFGVKLPVAAAAPAEAPAAAGPRNPGGGPVRLGPGAGGQRGGPGGREAVVVTAPVRFATINDRLTAIGDGAATHAVTLMSPANGTLSELLVASGDHIERGAVVARLDADAEAIAHERAALARRDAEATLARTEELASANAVTTVQLNAARLAAENARLEEQNARLALDRRAITSPIAGSVGLFEVGAGNSVTAQTVITTIVDTSEIVISFWVPERYASAVTVGMPVTVAPVALPGQSVTGKVSATDNRLDSASRTLHVQARVPNPDGRLRPGMSFSVALSFPGERFPSVDPLSIQWSTEGAFLWRYAEGKVERVPVEIIQRNSDGVLVRGELGDGDQVVTQGLQQLSAGASVRLLEDVLSGQQTGRPPAEGAAPAQQRTGAPPGQGG